MNPEIIYEDEKMIVCNKPAGMLSQSERTFEPDMVSELRNYRKNKGEDTFIGIINRLDRQVSGITVFAKTTESAAKLNKLLQQHTFNKNYYAIIQNRPQDESGVFMDYLLKDGKSNKSAVVSASAKGSKRAELEYEIVKSRIIEGQEMSLVNVRLITGRHHQIRVQFASRGYALLGDRKYGASQEEIISIPMKGIALCAYSVKIENQEFLVQPKEEIFKLFL